jgi:spore germination protein
LKSKNILSYLILQFLHAIVLYGSLIHINKEVINMMIHVVQSGETLFSISRQYSVDPYTLSINNGVSNGRLAIGQSLIIVKPIVNHVVKEGETLTSIASQYNVPINQLYRNNLFLKGTPVIRPMMTLAIQIEKDSIGSFMIGGYAYPFIDVSLLNTTLPFMSGLMPFTYGFKPDGSLVMLDDSVMITRAKVYGTKPVMHLSTLTEAGVFSVELADHLLNTQDLWGVLINNVLNVMKQKGYYGLDVDFEFLGAKNALKYAEFITFAREKLNEQGFPVLVALAPKTSVTQPGVLYEGHDYKALGLAANSVLLMTYEWGYTSAHT